MRTAAVRQAVKGILEISDFEQFLKDSGDEKKFNPSTSSQEKSK